MPQPLVGGGGGGGGDAVLIFSATAIGFVEAAAVAAMAAVAKVAEGCAAAMFATGEGNTEAG